MRSIMTFDLLVSKLWRQKQKSCRNKRKKEKHWLEGNAIRVQRFMAQMTALNEKGAYRARAQNYDIVLQ